MTSDNRTRLRDKLRKLMPEKPRPYWDSQAALRVELNPIRTSAEIMARQIGDDLPANEEELRETLWVFGEIICGELERNLNYWMHLHNDLLNTLPIKPFNIKKG